VHLVESERWSERGHGAAWAGLASKSRRRTIPGEHADLLLDHGDEVGAVLGGWLAEAETS
jgi:hypothetical protein